VADNDGWPIPLSSRDDSEQSSAARCVDRTSDEEIRADHSRLKDFIDLVEGTGKEMSPSPSRDAAGYSSCPLCLSPEDQCSTEPLWFEGNRRGYAGYTVILLSCVRGLVVVQF
jgi:hypothetical protein